VLGRFRAKDLESPPVALYYGVLLAAAGDHELAGGYLALAEKPVCSRKRKRC